jgi:hypothetical protein
VTKKYKNRAERNKAIRMASVERTVKDAAAERARKRRDIESRLMHHLESIKQTHPETHEKFIAVLQAHPHKIDASGGIHFTEDEDAFVAEEMRLLNHVNEIVPDGSVERVMSDKLTLISAASPNDPFAGKTSGEIIKDIIIMKDNLMQSEKNTNQIAEEQRAALSQAAVGKTDDVSPAASKADQHGSTAVDRLAAKHRERVAQDEGRPKVTHADVEERITPPAGSEPADGQRDVEVDAP